MYRRARGWHYTINDDQKPEERALLTCTARRIALGWLRSQVLMVDEDAVADIETAMGEALSNVARHARGATFFTVNIGHGRGWCKFRVEDDGKVKLSPRTVMLRGHEVMLTGETGGRGLVICDGLMDEFRVLSRRSGCVVTGRRDCGCGRGE